MSGRDPAAMREIAHEAGFTHVSETVGVELVRADLARLADTLAYVLTGVSRLNVVDGLFEIAGAINRVADAMEAK